MEEDLKQKLEVYKTLRDEVSKTDSLLKELKSSLSEATRGLADAMAEADEPTISDGAYTYSIAPKTAYSFISQEKLDDLGLDKFQVLRENGMGDLIVERVDPRSLSKALNEMAEADEPIPSEVLQVVSRYDYNDISRSKISAKKQQALKKAKENL